MKARICLIVASVLLSAPALAQSQQPPLPTEQLYRNMNAALAQDNARLGYENHQLQMQVQKLTEEASKKAPSPKPTPGK